jgi:CheY-like chemotaxis protein
MTVPATVEADPTAAQATRSRRILLIEDNRDSRQMLRMLLELNGHRVDDAADGLTGIKLAAEYAPEVALIDIGLPDVDGYAVAERIRKLLGAQVRLIALTGYGDPEARRRTAVAGFDLHLVKPVPPEELARSLEP